MIYLTQLIYIKDGQEEVFDEFEKLAIPLIPRYRGTMLFRLRPPKNSFISLESEPPYEVHLVSFPGDADFQQFLNDEQRKRFLHLKEQSIRATLLIKGEKFGG